MKHIKFIRIVIAFVLLIPACLNAKEITQSRDPELKPRHGIVVFDINREGARKLHPSCANDDLFLQLDNDLIDLYNVKNDVPYGVMIYARPGGKKLSSKKQNELTDRLEAAYPGKKGYVLFIVKNGGMAVRIMAHSQSDVIEVSKWSEKVINDCVVGAELNSYGYRRFIPNRLIEAIVRNESK
ncbi:MAG: hypothetical protein HGA38_01740 [Candidatus Moranbacteria bacterium]|nr:hypothetical protein [Candidatus Moranbacteria bacterium]